MGEARIRQVLIGIEVTLFAGVLAIAVPDAGLVALVLAAVGLLITAIEPKAPSS